MKTIIMALFLLVSAGINTASACSILYYVDAKTGKVYAANNEDYWYNVTAYLKIIPHADNKPARLWYGWDNFAQGGINEAGLFFDGATTPDEQKVKGYTAPGRKRNLGDEILAECSTVGQALDYLEQHKIALTDGHLLFGDKTGRATVVEWVNGKRNLVDIKDHVLMATNFLLTDKEKGNYPCMRYDAMQTAVNSLKDSSGQVSLKQIGNVLAKAVQPKRKDSKGKEYGTLYSSFINITDMEFILVYQLDNTKVTRLDLNAEFLKPDPQTIMLQ